MISNLVDNSHMAQESIDPISSWFLAGEELGEYIGIRFGRIAPGADQPEWIFLRHSDFDGIGGFAEILRRNGAVLPRLPQIKHPAAPTLGSFLRTWPTYLKAHRPLQWVPLEQGPKVDAAAVPPPAVAWHAFDETTTVNIRRVCRKSSVTVNSFLLKNLTKAVRPYLQDQSSIVPWMIPVNMRGRVTRERDTANHSSYVGVRVKSYETVHDVHRNIYAAMASGEHWANWYAYQSKRFMTGGMQRFLIRSGKCISQWNVGGFSNLGDWDPEKEITQPDCLGTYFFTPPVLRMQLLGAGCVTFQRRMGLCLQVHPDLTTSPRVPEAWMRNWVKEIEMDILSILTEEGAASPSAWAA